MTRLFLAALLCVVCSSASYARVKHGHDRGYPGHHFEAGIPVSGCSDPVMRPCYGNGRLLYGVDHSSFSGKEITRKSLRHRRFLASTGSKEITHRDTVRRMKPGLATVMAEGAGRVLGRPRAWCGWWLGRHLGMLDRKLWLAANWARVGRPARGPAVGAVVVWRHHVGIITGRADHGWIVKSGNDGHAVRERPRSVAGAIAFRWPT